LKEKYPTLSFERVHKIVGNEVTSKNYKTSTFFIKYSIKNVKTDMFPLVNSILNDMGVPVSSFMGNRNSHFISKISEASSVMVQEYKEGTFYSGNKDEFERLLDLLELIENNQEGKFLAKLPETELCSWDPLDLLRDIKKSLQKRKQKDDFDRKVESLFPEINNIIGNNFSSVSLGSKGITHWDLHPHNIIFKNRKIQSLVDLESVGIFPVDMAHSFCIYKMIRKSLSVNDGTINYFRYALKGRKKDLKRVARLAKVEIVRRLLTICKRHYLDLDSGRDYDLDKQIKSLSEIDFIFLED